MWSMQQKKNEIECLRTWLHVGDAGHRPFRNITIEHCCTRKRCSNHSITIIQKGNKRNKNQYQRKKKIGNNILVIYSLSDTKMENNIQTTKKRQRIEIEMVTYWLPCWLLWKPPTSKHQY